MWRSRPRLGRLPVLAHGLDIGAWRPASHLSFTNTPNHTLTNHQRKARNILAQQCWIIVRLKSESDRTAHST